MHPRSQLIALASVAKFYPDPPRGLKRVFAGVNLCLPADRRLAVLGARKSGKTTLLQMLAGKLAPDAGRIATPAPLSPLANAGALFHPQLGLFENLRFLARAYGLAPESLAEATLAMVRRSLDLCAPVKTFDYPTRRMLETAAVVALPFTCHLIDDFGQLPPPFAERVAASARERGAGSVFATGLARTARQNADAVVVIAQEKLYPFAAVEEGIEFFERNSR